MSEHALPTPAQTSPASAKRGRQRSQLTSMSEAARRLLKGTALSAAPMISRAGIHPEAHRVRSILSATMKKTGS